MAATLTAPPPQAQPSTITTATTATKTGTRDTSASQVPGIFFFSYFLYTLLMIITSKLQINYEWPPPRTMAATPFPLYRGYLCLFQHDDSCPLLGFFL